ncbi:MAG: RNA pyrophosphohydrolase [Rhodospirillales bacterium]|nr:RNA pyrophosphohydrolase [Rhodospirillales bacterium]MDP6774660.1 RNA pyrophosphohydrolase [Rhodospirillales bacterium]
MADKDGAQRPYRRCVGALLVNAGGQVFVGRRRDTGEEAWQLPQGGIDGDETPERAVLRELAEEIGTAEAEIIAESSEWLSYDLPEEIAGRLWGGRYRGQEQKWFALRFTGRDADIDLGEGAEAEFSDWKWVPIDDLPAMIIPFKRPVYEKIVDEFRRHAVPLGAP